MEGGGAVMARYKASINIQFDLTNESLIDRYLLSTSHADVLRGILESVESPEGMHSHLLVGPYGTGKSLVSAIVCQLFSRQFNADWWDKLLRQADRYDQILADRLRRLPPLSLAYLPVIINGKSGELRTIINAALHRALQQAGLNVTTPNEVHSILTTVERWRQLYPHAYSAFREHLASLKLEEAEWLRQVQGYSEELIAAFIDFYPSVTSGTAWSVGHEEHFTYNIERLLEELRQHGQGITLVYDEFGRFLQSLRPQDAIRNMQDLQDLAELANSVPNLQLLLVGHKHIRQYAAQSKEQIRTEFEKVEKRFRHYQLETDAVTYLRLAQEAGTEINAHSLISAAEKETFANLQSYPLFTEFTPYQLENYILQGLYPLHPAAVVILPFLSNVFGQNERTLFSFYGDDERYGLRDHVTQEDGYYYADKLFSYFDMDHADQPDQPALLLYRRIAPYLARRAPLQTRIARLLTLGAVSRLAQKQQMSAAFIAFALGVAVDEVVENLAQLAALKIVRYNEVRLQWELHDGSSVDIDNVIAERVATLALSRKAAVELLGKHLPTPYVLPNEYNDRMYMLRYATYRFVWFDQLEQEVAPSTPALADDEVLLVLFDDEEQMQQGATQLERLKLEQICAIPSFVAERVWPSLRQYAVIEALLQDSSFTAQDARLKNELQYLQQQTSSRIRQFVEPYVSFEQLRWWVNGEHRELRSVVELERLLSERLENTYTGTPQIRNEAFNRNRISAIQKRAVIDVINRLICQPEEPNLGITGYGPNYLIYVSTLKNNGFLCEPGGGLQPDSGLQPLAMELINHIRQKPFGSLADLVRILKEPPYGIRAAVIPVLFVALLRGHWEQLLFYAGDMLTTHLNGESVYELIERADDYEYRYFILTSQEKGQLARIGAHFGLPVEEATSFLRVTDVMLAWLRGLPMFAQITSQLSTGTQQIRAYIRATETDPYRNIRLLAAMEPQLVEARTELEGFMDMNRAQLESELFALAGVDSAPAFVQELLRLRGAAIGLNSRLQTLPLGAGMEERLLEGLIEHMVGVGRKAWSDATQELFGKQMKYEWELLLPAIQVAAGMSAEVDLTQPLSKKSQTLYANVKNILKHGGRDVPPQELKQLLMKLLQEV
ncbi:hypothetical protein [Paenibacillus thalictri]|uniref:ATP-binding protein n=1 Tax=Paenibacillus thalictri TaxID=2527873 RepID=A0A4Q9DV29_9BACL|nr:hypothetical protein [Paenibacillus thalictri]TBL80849.1 hypothetical protein EYB31_06430 [Paenibacillus thalictri]